MKTSFQGGARGYDAAKQTKGRKRNLLVDVLGLVVLASVLPANVQDSDGAMRLLEPLRTRLSRFKLIWADGGYNRVALRAWLSALRKRRNLPTIRLQIVRRPRGTKGFVVLLRRWVVERRYVPPSSDALLGISGIHAGEDVNWPYTARYSPELSPRRACR